MAAALAAMVLANSPYAAHYQAWVDFRLLRAPVSLWINDGLMVLFFLVVGLEIKHEILGGELSTWDKAMLPVCAAVGGVIAPALIYLWFNAGTSVARGWAIPAATDIAFALGVLVLFGRRVPASLKVFLMSLAVMDDVIAIVIIALFYTEQLHAHALALALVCVSFLWRYNVRGGKNFWVYALIGTGLWAAVLASGVHATIAGVVLAFLIPVPLGKQLIERLHPWVAYGIVPLFAFFNAGIPLENISLQELIDPLPLGILLGLFVGKQLGIFVTCLLLIRLGLARLPTYSTWLQLYAVCMIAGIGFTMSLFIGLLAFNDAEMQLAMRLGVLTGSLLSALFGSILLAFSLRTRANHDHDI